MNGTETVSSGQHPFDTYRHDRRFTTVCALLIALLLHVGLLWVIPEQILFSAVIGEKADDVLEVTLVPPEPLTADQLRFVEVNPEAPENTPDRQDQYSFKNQQLASEKVSDDPLEAPDVDGDTQSQKIIQGASEQAPPLPPGVYSPQAKPGEGDGTDGGKPGAIAQPTPTPAPPLPTPAFLEQTPVTEEGPGSRLETPGVATEVTPNPDPDAPINVYKPSPQSPSVEQAQNGEGNGGSTAKPMPRERPRLDPELIRGPLMQSTGSTRLRGTLAIDATFSEFGEYQQQFYAALQAGWYQEIEFYQPIDTSATVQVRFTIHADGKVTDVEVARTTASEIATIICESAIVKRSPFRPWTREMVQVFGQERTLTVAFHYR
ncbi:MAG: hypothetical protein ACSHX4_09035 [Opitutaceae bacterium]